jgi:subtilisin family serine protease
MSACYRVAAVAAMLLNAGAAFAATRPPAAGVISLNSVTIDVGRPQAAPEALRADAGSRGAEYVLVKFAGPVTAGQKAALAAAARQVYTYLPENAFLVRMDETPDRAARLARTGASWSGPYHPFYKISRYVAAVAADASPAKPQPLVVMLHVYPDADLERVVEELGQRGVAGVVGSRRNPFFSRIRLLLTPGELARTREVMAQIPEVFWVETEPRKVLLNDTTVWVGQSGLSAGMTTPVFARGIFGEGQVVGIIDTGIDADMCYFRDTVNGPPPRNECNGGTVTNPAQRKVLAVNFLWGNECAGGIANNEWDTQDHGTHVAGTVAGDNFATILGHDAGDGMAPGAKLVIQDGGYLVDNCGDLPGIGCPVVDLNPLFQQAYTQGARLHTNSWGDQENATPQNDYTTGSQDVDEFMWNHKDFQIFFAAGNSGPGAASVGSPSTAKSAVSVGSTLRGTSANSMSGFSSCGPTDDGRIKPEVTVPGSSIVSANADNNVASDNCNTTGMSGTSMASPGAAGLSALIRQYYADGFHPSGAASAPDAFTPSAALVRATLVNSAQQMTVPPAVPGNCQGWGRVLLDNALFFPGDARRLWVKDDAIPFPNGSTGRNKVYRFTVGAGEPFKVTLAWTDFPSTPAAMPHLNNDLDLIVTGPGGVYYGNVFAGGQSSTGGAPDRRNTLEQVLLATPTPGTYEVRVDDFNVPNGPQPLAVVVTGNVTPLGPTADR